MGRAANKSWVSDCNDRWRFFCPAQHKRAELRSNNYITAFRHDDLWLCTRCCACSHAAYRFKHRIYLKSLATAGATQILIADRI
jgi:hypothetical protein